MGTWDISAFGNDDAADFLFEFDDTEDLAQVVPILEEALDAVLDATPAVDAEDGAVAIAAAALVAAWQEPGLLGNDLSETLMPWPRANEVLPGDLKEKALAALDRVGNSEQSELARAWDQAGRSEEFEAELARWRSALS